MAQMQEAKDQASTKAREQKDQASRKAREQIDQRTTQAGERVSATAGDVRSVGEELRKQGKDGPARVADQMADRAERLGGYLKDSDSDRMLRDVEDFGRRKPWAVAAGGFMLGFAASRFLKASSRDRYRASHPVHTNGGMTTGTAPGTGMGTAPGTGVGAPGTGVGNAPGTPAGSGFEPQR